MQRYSFGEAKMITFITSSQNKTIEFKVIFPEKSAVVDNSMDLVEEYSIEDRKDFLEYKISQIDEKKYSSNIMIEDTIVRSLTGYLPYYNRIGQLIKKNGLYKTVRTLETYNPIFIESCVLVKNKDSSFFFEKKVLGNFKFHSSGRNKQLEDFFFIDKCGIERQLNFREAPRIQCFNEVKSLLVNEIKSN